MRITVILIFSIMSSSHKRKGYNPIRYDTLNYYKRIKDILDDDSSKEVDRHVIDNVFSQLTGEALDVCRNPETSAIIESLLVFASCSNIRSLVDVFSTDWMSICKDRCASHVVQKILLVTPKLVSDKIKKLDDEKCEDGSDELQLINKLLHLCGEVLSNVEDSLRDVHVSHVLRALLQFLGGTYVGEKVLKSRQSRDYGKKYNKDAQKVDIAFLDFDVPVVFKKQLKSMYKTLFKLENFGVYITDSKASPVLQTLLLVLHKSDTELCQKAIQKVIKRSRIKDDSDNVNVPPVAADNVGSYLVEQVIFLASGELFTELFSKLFKGRLLQFAAHPSANFVLQKLVKTCRDKSVFRSMIEELGEGMGAVFASRNYGVLVALVETSHRLSCKQDQLVKMLMEGLQCWEPEERRAKFATLLAAFQTYDVFYKAKAKDTTTSPTLQKVNYHGSLLLQQLINFSNTKLLETSLVSLEPAEVLIMSCDPCGSHVIEGAFKSVSIKDKTKETLIGKLRGSLVLVACHKNGSRAIESIWKNVNLKQRSAIAMELSQHSDRLKSDMFGRHIERNFALHHFKTRNSEWSMLQKSDNKRRAMFNDVLALGTENGSAHLSQ
ncbi:nucleolar protein 9-like isoform X2 [Mya arenaria]|uniref:nucleolar protein 9-like isoform X2 n=1 Tax=Mya arenaria TaxID=6604 RepID=UPI0022E3D3B4|nr:nucleolar protein 9-like isoform X2 [Mya arenaria]XP_052818623.1 nucleolar protein 9-like isoform X2 [Mya arenaria]